MYGNICELMVKVESMDSIELCESAIGGLAKYGMRVIL